MEAVGPLIRLLVSLAIAAAYFTHIATSIAAGAWGWLWIGGLLVPLGVVMGFLQWFGVGYG
jgi:hypothetical protein